MSKYKSGDIILGISLDDLKKYYTNKFYHHYLVYGSTKNNYLMTEVGKKYTSDYKENKKFFDNYEYNYVIISIFRGEF